MGSAPKMGLKVFQPDRSRDADNSPSAVQTLKSIKESRTGYLICFPVWWTGKHSYKEGHVMSITAETAKEHAKVQRCFAAGRKRGITIGVEKFGRSNDF